MDTIGIRELKNNLSKYLKNVKAGKKIIITERKKQFAVILPLGSEPEEVEILKFVRKGGAQWSGRKPTGLANRIRSKGGSVSDAIIEDRR